MNELQLTLRAPPENASQDTDIARLKSLAARVCDGSLVEVGCEMIT